MDSHHFVSKQPITAISNTLTTCTLVPIHVRVQVNMCFIQGKQSNVCSVHIHVHVDYVIRNRCSTVH